MSNGRKTVTFTEERQKRQQQQQGGRGTAPGSGSHNVFAKNQSASPTLDQRGWGEEVLPGVYMFQRRQGRDLYTAADGVSNVNPDAEAPTNFQQIYEDLEALSSSIKHLEGSNQEMENWLDEAWAELPVDSQKQIVLLSEQQQPQGEGQPLLHRPSRGVDHTVEEAIEENKELLRVKYQQHERLSAMVSMHRCTHHERSLNPSTEEQEEEGEEPSAPPPSAAATAPAVVSADNIDRERERLQLLQQEQLALELLQRATAEATGTSSGGPPGAGMGCDDELYGADEEEPATEEETEEEPEEAEEGVGTVQRRADGRDEIQL